MQLITGLYNFEKKFYAIPTISKIPIAPSDTCIYDLLRTIQLRKEKTGRI